MIAYLDASALVKLVLNEVGSDMVLELTAEAPVAMSAAVTRVEGRSALARARREGRLSAAGHRAAAARLDDLWSEVAEVEVRADVLDRAIDLLDRHGLRAYDAIQLASAAVVAAHGETAFACFDQELRAAAAAEGMVLSPAEL